MKKALIIGSLGQDGTLLDKYLSSLGYSVIGIDKNYGINILDFQLIKAFIESNQFNEIYFLAAYHNSSQYKENDNVKLLENSLNINVKALGNVLESIRLYSKKSRLFYASSSLIFENTSTEIQDEKTSAAPAGIYGITKYNGMQLCRMYRENFDVYASNGILYNHESEYRPEQFLSMKIVKGALNIKSGISRELVLGDLSSEVDWSYAGDVVKGFHAALSVDKPDDYIIASGKKRSVKNFVQTVFSLLELDWQKYVKEDPSLIGRKRKPLIGNSNKIQSLTKWKPEVSFQEMLKIMIESEKSK